MSKRERVKPNRAALVKAVAKREGPSHDRLVTTRHPKSYAVKISLIVLRRMLKDAEKAKRQVGDCMVLEQAIDLVEEELEDDG